MSDESQTMIAAVALVILLLLSLTPFLVFFIYVFYQNSKRKRIREGVEKLQQQLIAGRARIPVRYSSEARFRAWFKIFPWEGTGLLVASPGHVMFLGEKLLGAPVNLQFTRGRAEIKWLGKCPWPNGAVSWFEFDVSGEKHFFTSETGAFVFGSNKSTKAAYEQVQKCLADSGAGNI